MIKRPMWSDRCQIGAMGFVVLLMMAVGLIIPSVATAGDHDCNDFADTADLHARTGIVIPLDDDDHPVSPWKGATVVSGVDLKSPKDLLHYAGKPVVVDGANFKSADFSQLSLSDVCFINSDLSGSKWTGVKSTALVFANDDLNHADLEGASLVAAQITASNLESAKASRIDLTHSLITGGRMNGLDLRNANLTDVEITCVWDPPNAKCSSPHAVDVRSATLTRTIFKVDDLSGWQFDGARLDEAKIPLDQIGQFRRAVVVTSINIKAFNFGNLGLDSVANLSRTEWRALLAAWGAEPKEKNSFRTRIESIHDGGTAWLEPGEEALYADTPLPVPEAFRRTTIFRKLANVIWDSAGSTLYARRIDSHHFIATADAMGAHYDVCELDPVTFAYNRKTGWYGAPHKPTGDDPRTWEDVFRISPDQAEVVSIGFDDGPQSDYASCGNGVSFNPMRRIPSDVTLLKRARVTIDARAPGR